VGKFKETQQEKMEGETTTKAKSMAYRTWSWSSRSGWKMGLSLSLFDL
jgi:hypothetical protein